MNDKDRGALLGLLASAQASLDAIRMKLESEEPPIARSPEEPCEHARTKQLAALGGGTTTFCMDCGEAV